ncbi:hypothetical protein EVAR_68813_1 [Eumeta japonica]|uniref:Uncharacterized protein n=1 Tax=Eumeta variegata TaxID=151549 RepID=A0A4C1Z1A4_EUMVA|nr:hypothetical protein EVAR_68813_1 [Eumeta japonica]
MLDNSNQRETLEDLPSCLIGCRVYERRGLTIATSSCQLLISLNFNVETLTGDFLPSALPPHKLYLVRILQGRFRILAHDQRTSLAYLHGSYNDGRGIKGIFCVLAHYHLNLALDRGQGVLPAVSFWLKVARIPAGRAPPSALIQARTLAPPYIYTPFGVSRLVPFSLCDRLKVER